MITPLRPNGALLIDKPEGLTSQQVVSQLKWALINHGYAERGFKIGHGGTLDPFATGVLAVFIGETTKLADCYLHSHKAYEGHITLGKHTDTGDLTGTVTEESAIPRLSESEWQKLASEFTAQDYFQTPPMYSAKKQNGKALYELARAGLEVDRAAILKKIILFQVQVRPKQELFFQTECESGTYVRVLAQDLAKKAGTLAHLRTLKRTRSSDLQASQCRGLDETLKLLTNQTPLSELSNYLPLCQVALHIPSIPIDENTANELRQGLKRALEPLLDEIQKRFPEASYGIARLNQSPIALLENQKFLNRFRLQRIFN